MKDFTEQIEAKQSRKRHIENAIKKTLAGAALVGAAVLFTGGYSGDQRLVEETYTVKKGDTLRDIATEYLKKNTGGRRYILEFEQGIIDINPELQDGNAGHIKPGQKIRINYFVKAATREVKN